MTVFGSATTTFHQTWSQVVLFYAGCMALWGAILFFRRSGPTGSYLGALVIAEFVIAIQGVVGIVLLLQGHRPHNLGLHLLYGVVAFLTLPAGYLYSRNGTVRGSSIILGLACVFLIGLSIRAITTGS